MLKRRYTDSATCTFGQALLRALSLAGAVLLGGCAAPAAPAPDPSAQLLQALQKALAGTNDRVRILEDSLPLLACGPELRALFRDIRKECNAAPLAPSDGETRRSAVLREGGSCKAEQLTGAITGTERDTTHPIGQMLISLLRHEVVYVSDSGKITSARDKRLALLAAERRLPSTRFLAVTAPVGSTQDAEKRARVVIDRLIQLGIPEVEIITEGDSERKVRRFDNPWVYRITVPQQQLKPVDRSVPPESRDPQRAVYIFRTDCT